MDVSVSAVDGVEPASAHAIGIATAPSPESVIAGVARNLPLCHDV